jgi:hypothetical protein
VQGQRSCTTFEGNQTCNGGFYRCDTQTGECQEIAEDSLDTETDCYEHEVRRHWAHFDLNVLDLSQAGAPSMAPTLSMDNGEDDISVARDDDGLWMTTRRGVSIPDDTRPYVRYYAKKLDVSVPNAPSFGPDINIPGEVIYADGDTLFTRDYAWGTDSYDMAVNKVELNDNRAYLRGRYRFNGSFDRFAVDKRGTVHISHYDSDYGRYYGGNSSAKLTLLEGNMQVASVTELPNWASLSDAITGRAVFNVGSGIAVLNTDDPSAPFFQAYFAARGWPRHIATKDDSILVPAGRFGLYDFDLNEVNLLERE